nr:hypothetical protein [Candidatus Electrothrix aestuarii]
RNVGHVFNEIIFYSVSYLKNRTPIMIMIDALIDVTDRIIELVRIEDERMKARYEEIYKPSFEELRAVHSDYLKMFTELEWKVRKIDPDLPGNDPQGTGSPTEALEYLHMRRIELLPIREKLSAIETLLDGKQGTKLPETERRFLQSLANYFVVGGLSDSRSYCSRASILLEHLENTIDRQVVAAESIAQGREVDPNVSTLSDVRKECKTAMKELGKAWYEIVDRFNVLRFIYAEK